MILKEKIQQDLKTALKEARELEILTLRQLSAAFLNKEKEKQYKNFRSAENLVPPYTRNKLSKSQADAKDFSLTEEEMIEVISSEAKKRREAIEGFEKGGRREAADKERQELEILQKYLPEQLSEDEIRNLVKEAVIKIGAKEIKDIRTSPSERTLNASRILGKVMAELSPKTKGRADGSLVSKLVRELLAQ